MPFLINLCKILLLLLCAALVLGFGTCGILGLAALGNADGAEQAWSILLMTGLGFTLTALFGWCAWKLKRSLTPPDDEIR